MAKKKSPAELKEEGEALGTLIASARKREHSFAMLIGKEGLFIEADPKKPADVMRRKAKAAGGGSKGAQGILRVNGKNIEFVCEDEKPPRALSRLAKQHFRERGQKYKIMIMAAGGELLEDDDEETEEEDGVEARARPAEPEGEDIPASTGGDEEHAAPDTEASPAAAPAAPAAEENAGESEEEMRTRLRGEYEELKPRVEHAVETAPKGVGKKVGKLGELFESDLEEAPPKAGKVLALLRTTLEKAGIELTPTAPSTGEGDGASERPPAEGEAAQAAPGEATPEKSETGMLGGIAGSISQAIGGPIGSMINLPNISSALEGRLGLSELPSTLDDAMGSIGSAFGDVMQSLGETADELTGNPRHAEREAIAAQQEQLAQAFLAVASDPTAVVRIAEEMTRLTTMMETAEQISAIEGEHPETASAAREAMAEFDGVLGPGTPVTPELLAQIEAERVAAETRRDQAQAALDAAEAMPEGEGRDAAIASAEAELGVASGELETAESKGQAAQGKQQLTQAITLGPLSPSAPRPFSDQSAAQFVEAYTREPDLANFAVQTASTSENPDEIAGGMEMLCNHIDNGFADGEGNQPPEGFDGVTYAQNLVRGANGEGAGFMQDAESYIEGGGHLVSEPVPEATRPPYPGAGATDEDFAAWDRQDVNLRQRERTHYVTDTVMSPDGSIDTESEAAQNALGHLRFNPDVIDEPAPEVNGRVSDMYEMLSDDTNRQRAEGILQGVDKPEGAGAALVARSADINRTLVDPSAEDARQSVMMSLMTPVHQGDVGSCFATAGIRRLSEQDPLAAMENYANIAETGEYQPANGMDAIPAVMSFAPHEDPLIRSFEYSVATVMADMPGNDRDTAMNAAFNNAMDGLRGPVGTGTDAESAAGSDNWALDEAIVRGVLEAAFIVEYDALAQSPEQAADGASDHGGYFTIQVQGPGARRVINNEALFVEAVTERVISALGLAADDPRRVEIATTVSSRGYLDSMIHANGRSPWDLGGGGFATEADEVITGQVQQDVFFLGAETPAEAAANTQGVRTQQVLTGLLNQFDASSSDMVAISTNGIHSFNGLPDHPSLAPLQEGGPGNFAQNMQDHLVDPGREIANGDLAEHQAEEVLTSFRTRIGRWDGSAPADRATILDRANNVNIPTAETSPAEMRTAIMAAYSDYLDKVSADDAAGWQADEVAAGRPCTNAQRDAKAVTVRQGHVAMMDAWLSNTAARVTPLPQFTVADSNWGDAEGRTEFVIAPDPMTGEPRMWSKSLPSGEMHLTGADWEDTMWYENQPAPPAAPAPGP